MTISPWLVVVIEACIAASCSSVSLFIIVFCMGVTITVLKHFKEEL